MKFNGPIIFIVLFACANFGNAQTKKSSAYLDQVAPGTTPVIFAPDVVSKKDDYEFGAVFSNSGREFYYAVNVGPIAEIRCIKHENNQWSKPATVITSDRYSHNDPFLSPDDSRLFFISDRPIDGKGEKKDYDLWYMERQGDSWSPPVNAGPAINSDQNEYYVSFSKGGTMYFSSNGRASNSDNNYEIFSAKPKGRTFEDAIKLGESVNTAAYEGDVFVAPDESYLIFCGDRADGHGNGDLYISFRVGDKSWSNAVNMGTTINTPGHELCPYVSKDGKYLFYTSNKDIYWVDAKVIDTLRK